MKRIVASFLFVLTIASNNAVVGQNQRLIDSLSSIVASDAPDTLRVQAGKKIAWEYYFTNRSEAPKHVRQMIAIAKKANYVKGIWDGFNIMSVIHFANGDCDSVLNYVALGSALSEETRYHNERIYGNGYAVRCLMKRGDYPTAHQFAQQSLGIASKSANNKSLIKAHLQLASVSYGTGDYQQCVIDYLKADSLMGDDLSIDKGETLQNIAQIYHVLENKVLEKRYLKEAREVFEKMGDDYGVHAVGLAEGNLALSEKDYTTARDKFSDAKEYFEAINDTHTLRTAYRWVALSYYYLNDYPNALLYYSKAIGENPQHEKGDENLNSVYHELGRLYLDMRRPDDAIRALSIALQISRIRGDLNMQVEVTREFARYHALVGDFKKAYEAQQETLLLADSLNRIRSSRILAETETRFQTQKKERAIDRLQAENQLALQQRESARQLMAILSISALILIGVLYLLFRTKQKSNIRLKQLDLLRSHFFSNISHEFRTPLTLILGPVENRLRQRDLTEDERDEFEMIQRQGKQLLNLVDQLLELSRIQAGGVSLKIESGDACHHIKAIAGSFRFMAETSKIDYTVSIAPGNNDMWFDRDVIQKILSNLLSNALKYTSPGGWVRFECMFSGQKMRLVVMNSGDGIPEELLTKIFDRYYQVNGDAGGIGIGLALVKELVQLHRGTIDVQSIPREKTVFSVTLPVARELLGNGVVTVPAQPAEEAITLQEDEVPDGTSLILIVEDNPEIRGFIRKTLEPSFRCVEAEGGTAGLSLAREMIPDLILSDVMMPDLDGLLLCKQLKSDERTSHIPVIFLTARASEADTLIGFETGADDYVVKPFSSELLLVRIRKLIELRKALHARFSQEVVLRPQEIKLNSADEHFLQKVQVILDNHLVDSSFTAERFAEEAGMSRMQLHRKLTGLTGMSANVFIRTNRLNLAATLLHTPGVNIAEVGYQVGFSDPSYFTRCFREHFMCTPTEYIRQNCSAQADR